MLGRLLVMQQSLGLLHRHDQMVDFIRMVFLDVPGVAECRVQLAATPEVVDAAAGENDSSVVLIRIRTRADYFGEIRLLTDDLPTYKVYEPFLDNTAQAVGTLLENRHDAARLSEANNKLNHMVESLERRVEERTRDILKAKNRLAASSCR